MALFYLLRPKTRSAWNVVRRARKLPGLTLLLLTFAFLVCIHFLMLKLLGLIDEVPLISLALKQYLMSAVLLCLMFLLTFSNLINALSAFFLGRELELVLSSPLPGLRFFAGKFLEVLLRSSWMVVLLLGPVLSAFGQNFEAPLWFYPATGPLLLPYCVLCTGVGVTGALLLAVVLPVRRAATVLRFLFILGVGALIVILRLLQPEELIRPEHFVNFGKFLIDLHRPFAVDLPSYWTGRVLLCFLTNEFLALSHFGLLYVGSAAGALGASMGAARLLFWPGWNRMREGGGQLAEDAPSRARPGSLLDALVGAVATVARVRTRAARELVAKELRVYARSPVLWTQTALLGVIVVIYVYNIRLLPADALVSLRADLPSLAAFCNVAFIAFIVTAAALRFGFPSVSMEGRAIRLIASSPVTPRAYVDVKYWCSAAPLRLLAFVLAATSSWLLESAGLVTAIVLADSVVLAGAIAALAVCFGVLYADFDAESFAELPSGWGGMLFMLAALVLTLLFLALQAYPCYVHFLTSTSLYRPSALERAGAWGALLGSFVLCGVVAGQARRVARRRLMDGV